LAEINQFFTTFACINAGNMKKELKLKQKQAANQSVKTNTPKKKLLVWPWAVGIALAAFVVYLQTIGHDFVNWDDDRYLTEFPERLAWSWASVKFFFTNYHFVMYLPITMLTYMVDTKIGGLDSPSVFHFSNTLYHAINTSLVFIFVYQLKKRYASPQTSRNYAIIVAAMFGLVTMHTESVAWVAERKDLVYSLFYFLSLIFYVKYTETAKAKFYLTSLFMLLLSLISKAQAMPLVFMLVGIDLLLKRKVLNTKVILEKLPFFLLGAIFGYIAILGNQSEGTDGLVKIPFLERMVYACYGFTTYIVKLFVPYKLSVIYPYPQTYKVGVTLFYYLYLIPAAAIATLFFYSLKVVFRNNKADEVLENPSSPFNTAILFREISFGLIYFIFNIGVVLQVFSYHNFIMADRYSYMSSIGIFFIVAALFQWLWESKKVPANTLWAIFAIFMLVQTVLTHNRIQDWKDSLTLWHDTRAKYPDVIVAWYNAGNLKAERKDLQAAIADYNEAIRRNPEHVGALSNRGVTWGKLNNPKAALEDFNKVIKLDSLYNNVYSNRGNVKVMLNDYESALLDYDKALKIKPDYVDALFNRGLVKNTLRKSKEALEDLNAVVRLSPNFPMAFYNRGLAKANLGLWKEAIADYNIEQAKGNDAPDIFYSRAFANFNLKNYKSAIADYDVVIKSINNVSATYLYRGLSKIFLGMKNEGCTDLQKAVSLGDAKAQAAMQQFCR
jgi:protein O-mannosyl-transferase